MVDDKERGGWEGHSRCKEWGMGRWAASSFFLLKCKLEEKKKIRKKKETPYIEIYFQIEVVVVVVIGRSSSRRGAKVADRQWESITHHSKLGLNSWVWCLKFEVASANQKKPGQSAKMQYEERQRDVDKRNHQKQIFYKYIFIQEEFTFKNIK